MVIGQITREYIPPKAAGYYVGFSYKYEGKEMSGSREITDVIDSPQRFVNKFFPVVVSKEDADESAILTTPKDFSFFDKAFPDSLIWVVQFVDDSQR